MFTLRASKFSIEMTAKPESLACIILFLRYVCISLSFEKDLSAVATVTGRVRKRIKATRTSWKLSKSE